MIYAIRSHADEHAGVVYKVIMYDVSLEERVFDVDHYSEVMPFSFFHHALDAINFISYLNGNQGAAHCLQFMQGVGTKE